MSIGASLDRYHPIAGIGQPSFVILTDLEFDSPRLVLSKLTLRFMLLYFISIDKKFDHSKNIGLFQINIY